MSNTPSPPAAPAGRTATPYGSGPEEKIRCGRPAGRCGEPSSHPQHLSRRFRRLETRRPCTFEFEGTTYPAHLLDLSHGGSFLEAGFVPPEDSLVGLCLSLVPSRRELTFRGRVVHSGQYLEESRNFSGFGVEFEGMTKVLHGLVDIVSRRLCEAQSQRWGLTLCQGPGRKS